MDRVNEISFRQEGDGEPDTKETEKRKERSSSGQSCSWGSLAPDGVKKRKGLPCRKYPPASFTLRRVAGRSGRSAYDNTHKSQEQIAKIREQLERFDTEFIFNMDETEHFFRCFPRGTIVTRAEGAAGLNRKTARGTKAMKAKDRCTVAARCNTTASLKVPLAVICTAKTPIVFRHIRKPAAPYYAQRAPGSIHHSTNGGLTETSRPS